MEKLIGLKERLVAIGEFANESAKLIEEIIVGQKATVSEKAPEKKAEKPAKPENKAEETKPGKKAEATKPAAKKEPKVTVESVIEEYGLDKMSVPELKEILNDAEVAYNKKAKAVAALAPVVAQAIIDGKVAFEDEEEGDENEPESVSDEDDAEEEEEATREITEEELAEIANEYGLNDLDIEELRDYCNSYELAFHIKAKKLTLVNIIAKAIAEGVIEVGDDEDESEDDDSVESEDDGDESEEEAEVSPEVAEAESKVRKDIAAQIKKGKLTVKKMKEFLKQYYEGDADCKDCKGCSEEEIIECYTDIHVALVDDEGEVNEMGQPYVRRDANYCCGKELQEMEDDTMYCEICGETYE